MADIFISYSRRDGEFVERLRESLAEHDKDVWVDREDIGTDLRTYLADLVQRKKLL